MSSTSDRPVLEPSDDHPIAIAATGREVVVRAGDTEIARSRNALTLQEGGYGDVLYIPLADIDETVLEETATSTYCPYKGDAGYYSVVTPGGTIEDAGWFYADPFPAVEQIADHVAFYTDRVDVAAAQK